MSVSYARREHFAGADHVEAMKFRRCYDCNPPNGRRSKLGMAVRDNGTASKSVVNRWGNRIPPRDFPSVCPADCHIQHPGARYRRAVK